MAKNSQSRRSLVPNLAAAVVLLVLSASPLLSTAAQDHAADSSPEEALIRAAVRDLYVRGLQIRDFGLIKKICLPEAKLLSAGRDGVLRVTSLEKWSTRFDPKKPPFQDLAFSIEKVDVVGTAAQVKIQFMIDHSRPVTDFLYMLKVEDEWRISQIIDY